MKHDPFYSQILTALDTPSRLDTDVFEEFAADLVRSNGFSAVPILGGSDDGMDGGVADGQGEAFPLVVTVGKDCIGNLTRNLDQYIARGGTRNKAIFVTAQELSKQRQNNLRKRASEKNFTLVQIYERTSVVSYLYRNSHWCKELLHLAGKPSALSVIPLTQRPLLNIDLEGREDELAWLMNTAGDRLLIGEPGSGKTFLLYQLTKQSQALFVVTSDLGDIANAIRDQNPRQLIVDDAHVDPDFLIQLKRLRSEIRADFDIIASCWNGDRNMIAEVLGLPDGYIRELRRLTRRQMVNVIREAGIQGVPWLINEIIDQAAGLPGLAVTLTRLCLQNDVRRIQNADALLSTILNFYVKRIDTEVQGVLAAFSLGGNRGMSKTIVAQTLKISPRELRETLAQLAFGGVVESADFIGELLRVRPEALRHALIRETFFSGVSAFSPSLLNHLLEQSPDSIASTEELIYVKARGGNVSSLLIEENLQILSTVSSLWAKYAWLGVREAKWVLDHYSGSIANMAHPVLEYVPQLAIPVLISEAIGDNRRLNATPEHPLRRLETWILSANPGTPSALDRRRMLIEAARKWVLENPEEPVGFKALLYALDPRFEGHVTAPGDDSSFTIRFGYLTADELNQLQEWWSQVIELTEEISVVDWQPFIEIIRHWAYPNPQITDSPTRDFVPQMITELAEATKNSIAASYELRRLFDQMVPDFAFAVDPVVDVLYPIEGFEIGWREQQKVWQERVYDLAQKWCDRSPDVVIQRIEEIEREMVQINPYPRLSPNFVRRLAELTEEPVQYVKIILQTDLSGDVLLPVLNQAAIAKQDGWETAIEESLSHQRFRGAAIQVIFSMEAPTENLLQKAIAHIHDFPLAVDLLFSNNYVSADLLIGLLEHHDPQVAREAVRAEWQREPVASVRSELRVAWEKALLTHNFDDYWLGEIFRIEHQLAYSWLEERVGRERFSFVGLGRAIKIATGILTRPQRLKLIEMLPVRYGNYDVVAHIVGDDLEVYSKLLSSSDLTEFHLCPLADELNNVWQQMAKLAYQAGYTAEEIVSRTMFPVGVAVSWSGKESSIYKNWLDEFNKLQDTEDETIRIIAQAGSFLSNQRYQELLEREHQEDVYGSQ